MDRNPHSLLLGDKPSVSRLQTKGARPPPYRPRTRSGGGRPRRPKGQPQQQRPRTAAAKAAPEPPPVTIPYLLPGTTRGPKVTNTLRMDPLSGTWSTTTSVGAGVDYYEFRVAGDGKPRTAALANECDKNMYQGRQSASLDPVQRKRRVDAALRAIKRIPVAEEMVDDALQSTIRSLESASLQGTLEDSGPAAMLVSRPDPPQQHACGVCGQPVAASAGRCAFCLSAQGSADGAPPDARARRMPLRLLMQSLAVRGGIDTASGLRAATDKYMVNDAYADEVNHFLRNSRPPSRGGTASAAGSTSPLRSPAPNKAPEVASAATQTPAEKHTPGGGGGGGGASAVTTAALVGDIAELRAQLEDCDSKLLGLREAAEVANERTAKAKRDAMKIKAKGEARVLDLIGASMENERGVATLTSEKNGLLDEIAALKAEMDAMNTSREAETYNLKKELEAAKEKGGGCGGDADCPTCPICKNHFDECARPACAGKGGSGGAGGGKRTKPRRHHRVLRAGGKWLPDVFSRHGLRKAGSLPEKKAMVYVGELFEKKCMADIVDEDRKNPFEPMPDFTSGFFMQNFGMPRLARKEMHKFLAAVQRLAEHRPGCRILCTVLGLTEPTKYSDRTAMVVCGLLRRMFGNVKGISEQLNSISSAGDILTVVARNAVVKGVVGVNDLDDDTKWKCPQLLEAATPDGVRELCSKIMDLPVPDTLEGAGARADEDPSRFVRLTDMLETVLDWYLERVVAIQDRLIQLFTEHDADGNGRIEYSEFVKLLNVCNGGTEVPKEKANKIFRTALRMSPSDGAESDSSSSSSDSEGEQGELVSAGDFAVIAWREGLGGVAV